MLTSIKILEQTLATTEPQVRLDKWLWAARFYKTRSLARDMVQGGKVRYNGQRTKPSKIVEIGDTVKLAQGYDEKEIIINAISDTRRTASEAQKLYRETESSVEKRSKNAELRKLSAFSSPHPETRPDKKQRRQLIKFKEQDL